MGYRVIAWHDLQVGIPGESKPCLVGPRATRKVGEDVTDEDGAFSVAFDAPSEFEDACVWSSNVRIDVFDGATRVWSSSPRRVVTLVRFDHEIAPGCTPESTGIRVINDAGATVPGAQVFVNGALAGLTDATGHLVLSPAVNEGNRLAARSRLYENQSQRDEHDDDSDRDWNYRVYITSVRVSHDDDGETVELRQQTVTDPSMIQELRVRRSNVLVGLNLRASIEWDATGIDARRYTDRLTDMSELLYNATDGQFLIERLAISDDGRYWDEADYRIYANQNQPSRAIKDAIFDDDGYVRLNPNDAHFPGTLLHELGHYAFGLGDEYEATDDWDPANGPTRCTLRSSEPDGPFADGNEKDSCLMRGNRFRDQKKFCSSHPEAPHVAGTDQGPGDCWNDIVDRYGDVRWLMRTPRSRGAIVGRLPDSGVPLRGTTDEPAGIDRPPSFIPLSGWKTTVRQVLVNRTGLCDGLVVRIVRNGQPVIGAELSYRTTAGRDLYLGATKSQYRLAYGVNLGPGELLARGVHVGDELKVWMNILAFKVMVARREVSDCGSPLVIEVPAFLAGTALQDLLREGDAPAFVRPPTLRPVWPMERSAIESGDERLRVVLPEGLPSDPGVVEVAQVSLPLELEQGVELASGPYSVTSPAGAETKVRAVLHFRVPSVEVAGYSRLDVVRVEPDGSVVGFEANIHDEPFVASAEVDRFGTYLLAAALEERSSAALRSVAPPPA